MLKYFLIFCLFTIFNVNATVPFVYHKKKLVEQYKKQNKLSDQQVYKRANKSTFYFLTIYPARKEDYVRVIQISKGHPYTRLGNSLYLGPIYGKNQLKQLIHSIKSIGLFKLQTINTKEVYALRAIRTNPDPNATVAESNYYQDKAGQTISFRGPASEEPVAIPVENGPDYFDSANFQLDYNKLYTHKDVGHQILVRGEAKYKYAWDLWDVGLGTKVSLNQEVGSSSTMNYSLSLLDSYVSYAPGDLVVTGGFLHVDWGRMDEYSAINRLSRNDRTRGWIDSSNEQAMANFVLRLEYFLDQQQNQKIDVLLVPKIQHNTLPNKNSIWYPIDEHNLAMQGIGTNDRLERFIKVGKISTNEESSRAFGVRYGNRTLDSFDYALNLIYYGDLDPYVHLSRPFVEDLNRPEVQEEAAVNNIHKQQLLALSYRPHTLIGFDFSQDLQTVLWKGEIAYITNNYLTRKNYTLMDSDKVELATSWNWPWKQPNINLLIQINGYHYFSNEEVLDHTTDFALTSKLQFVLARDLYVLEPIASWSLVDDGKMIGAKFFFKGMDNVDFFSYLMHFMGTRDSKIGFYQNNSLVGVGLKVFL